MATPLETLQSRSSDWLLGIDYTQMLELAQERYQIIRQLGNPIVLIAEADPLDFLASFIAACSAGCPVFLTNPGWGEWEWQQVFEQVTPDLIWGNISCNTQPIDCPKPEPGWIMIPTGGSSGVIRFSIHTWETLLSSVMGFQQYFQVESIHSYCLLPLYHVSGLMQFLRSLLTNGKFLFTSYKNLLSPSVHSTEFFISLVPTQLHRLLQHPEQPLEWLAQFQTVLLGGAPAWTGLLETARNHNIRLAPTYGMTETASQVVTLKPEDFLQGQQGCGQVLPHAQVFVGAGGAIAIQAQSLALGYYPHRFSTPFFQTDDLGYFDGADYLHIIGRHSQKIITGGENVYPAEVEAAIRASGLVKDVYVLGVADSEWGEAIAAVYVAVHSEVSIEGIQTSLCPTLSRYKHPKHWIRVAELPRNGQGKVNDQMIRSWLWDRSNI